MDLLNAKLGAVPTPISRAQLYKTNPDLRQLRDKVDDCIELVNDGNDALYSSPATAENKLRDATNLASSLLTSIDRHKLRQGEARQGWSEPASAITDNHMLPTLR